MDKRYDDIGKAVGAIKRLEIEALVLLKVKEQLNYESLEKIEQYVEDRLRRIEAQTASHKHTVSGLSSELREDELEDIRKSLREIQKRIGE